MFRRNGSNALPLVAMLVALGAFGCSKAKTTQPDYCIDCDVLDETEGAEVAPVGLNVTITSPAQGVTTPVSGKLELGILVTDDLKTPVTLRVEVLKARPPSESTATSVVPPPISTTIEPVGSVTGSPAPIAAAIGSSIK